MFNVILEVEEEEALLEEERDERTYASDEGGEEEVTEFPWSLVAKGLNPKKVGWSCPQTIAGKADPGHCCLLEKRILVTNEPCLVEL